jgi:alanine-glyoxylate transaminase/serine-glyoxylate transaminase/serine-pyruvate transaminase
LMGALSGVEMALSVAGVPYRAGGAQAAMAILERRDDKNAMTSQRLATVG